MQKSFLALITLALMMTAGCEEASRQDPANKKTEADDSVFELQAGPIQTAPPI